MSTKIYSGYVLPLMTLMELNEFSKRFREKAIKVANEQAEKFLATRIASKIDQLCLLDEASFVEKYFEEEGKSTKGAFKKYEMLSPLQDQYYNAYDRYQEVQRTQYRDGEVDLDASVVYIPLKDKILAIFFSQQKAIKELWEQEEKVSYYGYWDNTDQDEECTEEEWTQRKKDWEEALPGYTAPIDAGIIAEFVKGYPNRIDLSKENILSHVMPAEKRAVRLAKEKIQNKKYKEFEADGEKSGYEMVLKARQWLETAEGKKQVEALANEIQAKLLPEITLNHLKASYKEIKNDLLN